MTRRRRVRAAALAVAAVAALMVAFPGAGMAGGTATTERLTAAATMPAPTGVNGQVLQFTKSDGVGTMTTITCYGQSDYPHASSMQPGTVHAKSRSWCTAPIREVRVQAELYRYLPGYGYTQVGTGSLDYCLNCTGAAAPKLQSIAIDICQGSTQYYATVGRHYFVAPAGYEPPAIGFDTGTPGTAVTCKPY